MTNDNELTPPSPNKIPYVMKAHGDTRVDNYYWLRDDTRSKSEVLNYLKLEKTIKLPIKKYHNDYK